MNLSSPPAFEEPSRRCDDRCLEIIDAFIYGALTLDRAAATLATEGDMSLDEAFELLLEAA